MQKVSWIDNLRVLATISVIITHVAGAALIEYSDISTSTWWISIVLVGITHFCVPVFIMISGALMLTKEYPVKDFLKKRIMRVFLPFAFWSLIYLAYELFIKHHNGESLFSIDTLKFVADNLLYGVEFHLWYIYMIIGIYLFIPIIGRWVRSTNSIEIRYFLTIWIITLVLNWFGVFHIEKGVDLRYFSGYLGYLILGYYLSTNNYKAEKNQNKLAISLIIIGLLVTVIGTSFLTYYRDKYSRDFIVYLTPNIMMLSAGVFLLIKNIKINQAGYLINIIKKTRDMISRYSYGIYLSHVFTLLLLDRIGINHNFINPAYGIFITTTLCLILSFIITFILNKLPFGKYISG